MSIDLILEVMDHAPADLTSGERLVLVVIAERANEKTRQARQSERWTIDTIAERAGMKRSGVKAALQGLAKKGCEVRVPVKHDAKGRPVFAFEGTAMTFQIPRLSKRGGHSLPTERGDHSISSDVQEGWPQHPRGVAVASERGGHSHPQSLKEPSKNPQTSSPLPPVDASEPSSTSTQEEGDGVDFDQEKRTSNLVDTVRQIRPHWSKKKITDAITASLDDGRPLDLIERVFPTLAADPDTDYPGRLPKDGPWWNIDQQERTGDRPPWCGQCDEIVRQVQVESQYGGGMVFTRCPRCHPMNQPDATQTSKVNGEFGRHTESWQRRRDRAMSTPERRLTQALDVAAELDGMPVYHPDHPRRLINSHADQDRYDENL